MNRYQHLFALALAFCAISAFAAKDPGVLVSEFNDVLPSGMEVLMAWAQVEGGKGRIYAVSSFDGVVYPVTDGSLDAGNPQITYNGSRIVYQAYDRNEFHVINLDGSGDEVFDGSGSLQDYWYDSDAGIEYAVTYDGQINIATGDMDSWPASMGDDGARISPDGKFLAADFEPWGIMNTATGDVTSRGNGGCVCNISPDNEYSVMVQQEFHQSVNVRWGNGGSDTYNLVDGILGTYSATENCTDAQSEEFQESRWPHPDYVTFPLGNVAAGPFLVQLKDNSKWVAVYDDIGCALPQAWGCSSVDAYFYDPTDISRKTKKTPSVAAKTVKANAASEMYLVDGRRIGASAQKSGVRGVAIRRLLDNRGRTIKTVLME